MFRELIIQAGSTEAVHEMRSRPGPSQIEALYQIDAELADELKPNVAIVDDVLTTGAHFRAAKSALSARFPEQKFIGLFLARTDPSSFGSVVWWRISCVRVCTRPRGQLLAP